MTCLIPAVLAASMAFRCSLYRSSPTEGYETRNSASAPTNDCTSVSGLVMSPWRTSIPASFTLAETGLLLELDMRIDAAGRSFWSRMVSSTTLPRPPEVPAHFSCHQRVSCKTLYYVQRQKTPRTSQNNHIAFGSKSVFTALSFGGSV